MIGQTQQKFSRIQWRSRLIYFAVFTVLTVYVHRDILDKFPLVYGDLSTFPKTYSQAFSDFFYAWKDRGLGIYRSPGYLFPLIQGIYLFFVPNMGLAQLTFIGTIILFGYLITSHVLRKYVSVKNELIIFIFSAFYVYSPIMLGEFMGGTFYTTMTSFMIFPIIYFWTSDLIESPDFQRATKLLLGLGILFSLNIQMVVIYLVALFCQLVTTIIKDGKYLRRWLLLGLVYLGAILFSSNFVVDSLGFVSTKNHNGGQSNFSNSTSVFLSEVHYTYSESVFSNVFRIGGFANPMRYSESNALFTPFLVLVIISLIYWVWSNKLKSVNFVSTSFIGYLFTSSIIALTGYHLIDKIYLSFPTLFLFRNPAKMTLISTFFLVILLALSVDHISERLGKIAGKVFVLLVGLSVFVYIWPIYSGDRGLVSIAENENITLSETLISASNDLDMYRNNKSYPRSIWLPGSHDTTSIKLYWLDPHKLESETGISQFNDSYFDEGVVSEISKSISKSDPTNFKKTLDLAGIGYLVILNDNADSVSVNKTHGSTYLTKGSLSVEDISKKAGLVLLKKAADYSIYQNLDYIPLFSLASLNGIDALEYKKISSSEYDVYIPSNSEGELVFNQSYNEGWVIKKTTPELSLKDLNQSHKFRKPFANSWQIKIRGEDAVYKIYFKPQDYLDLNILASTLALIIGTYYLVRSYSYKKKI